MEKGIWGIFHSVICLWYLILFSCLAEEKKKEEGIP